MAVSTLCFSIVLLIVTWAFIVYYDDNFNDVNDKIKVIEATYKGKLDEKKVESKCWEESRQSTSDKIILYSECDGTYKTFETKVKVVK